MRSKGAPVDSPRSPGEASSSQDQFAHDVHDALTHLYDLAYLQTHPLVAFASHEPGARTSSQGRALQRSLKAAIEALQPGPEAGPDSRAGRSYRLLTRRFVDGLPIEAVARELGVSEAQYHREQRKALVGIVAVLRGRWELSVSSDKSPGSSDDGGYPARLTALSRTPRAKLPVALTSFVGRERELTEVRELLREKRLVTLTGTGGCGKTRLAYEVASGLTEDYPDGVQAVELAALADPELVPGAVARALGVADGVDRTTTEQLSLYLRSHKCLLVLDNCEHLLDGCALLVEALLRECPTLTILATSREPLGVPGEATSRVPPLEAPAEASLPRDGSALVDSVAAYPAVRLFIDRATSVAPVFQLSESNARAVALVCHRLDGIPLAIELAAAWVRLLSVDELLLRLEDRFRLLTGVSRTVARRHQTLLATVEWSYERLSEEETSLFGRLAVFAGGWSLEAAEAICAGGSIEGGQVLDLLARLVDKSLVVVEGGSASGTRYRLLETLREYGQQRLQSRGEAEEVRDRHAAYFIGLAERAEPELHGPRQGEWLARLAIEGESFHQAMQWLLKKNQVEAALRLAGALWWFWAVRGRLSEGRTILGEALAKTEGVTLATAGILARAWALQRAGALALFQGDQPESRALLGQSLRLFRSLGDSRGMAWSLIYEGWRVVDGGDPAGADPFLEEALALARETEDRLAEAWALARLGLAWLFQGDFRRAETVLAEGLKLSQSLGDRWGAAWSRHLLAVVYLLLREEPEPGVAERLEMDSLAAWRELDSRRDKASSQAILAFYYVWMGRLSEAGPLLRESLPVQVEIGDMFGVGCSLEAWSALAAARGQAERALRLFGALESLKMATGMDLEPASRSNLDIYLRSSREMLGPSKADLALRSGQAMALAEAVEYAMRDESAD